jgi:Spy/CpxP family protein refolding chaperone
MTLFRYWKIGLGLAVVFIAGAVTGSVATHQWLGHRINSALNFDHWKLGVMEVLQSKLNLTPEQHEKIAASVDARGQEIRQSFARAFDDSGHLLVRLQVEVDQVLTPQQRAIHAQMKRDFRAEVKRRFHVDLPEEP